MKLGTFDIAVQAFSLAATESEIDALREDLAPDELARVSRLVSPTKRRRAVVSRGNLRRILGRNLGCAARSVPLTYAIHGKPRIASSLPHSIRFNLAHCADVAVMAFGADAEIGVDIERLRHVAPEIARVILSSREQAELDAVDPDDRSNHLLARWTMKEAAVKAIGCGFQRRPTALEMGALEAHEPVTIAAAPLASSGTVTVRNLFDLWPGHVAAVAVLFNETAR